MNAAPLLKPFEALFNRNLKASTPAREFLATVKRRAFAIQVGAPVTGTPLALTALLAGRADGRFTASGVTISGDAEIAAAFKKLLRHARPDLEGELARITGDVPAPHAARAAKSTLDWGRRAVDSLGRNVGEFLIEEGRDLVPWAELDAFHTDVDRVEPRVAILAARLQALPD